VSFAFVWAGTLNLAIIYPLMMVYTVGVGINIPNSMAGALEVDPKIAGSGAALLGFTSFSAMSLSSFLVGSVESGSGLGMTGMLATLSVPGLLLAIASVFLSRRAGR
jgi:DHA1 family bicyclomycin/chloramphenicol resistance-like MFS transporter